MRTVPESIRHPDWAEDGIPKAERRLNRSKIDILDAKGQLAMRNVCILAREVLDITAAELKPGITTDYLDEICHKACIERDVGRDLHLDDVYHFLTLTVVPFASELQ
jgi:methionyl aminopeptidase